MKKILSFLVLMCVSLSAMASETSVKNAEGVEIWYDFDSSTKTASVTCKGSSWYSYSSEYTGEVVIPSTVTYEGEKYSVTSIGDYAFYCCYSLTSITIPEGVTSIGDDAFSGCDALTSITLPEGVTSIGYDAFYGCSSLTSITIPESLTSIGDYAFYNCYRLYEIYNKSDLTITAGSWNNGYVAYYAKNVYSEGESKLKTVGDYIFYVDGEDIELIAYTGSETSITLPSDYEGKNYNIGDYAFYECSALTSITLPEGLTSIGDDAFYCCYSLTSTTLPESLTSIGDEAFYYCYRLYEVYNKSNLTITAGNSDNGYVAYYAKNVYSEGESKLKTVGDYIFYVDGEDIELIAYTGSETSITLPSDYEGKNYNIGDYAFYDCNSLTSITLPEGVTSIGKDAFAYCSALTSITIPDSLTSIGDYAFYDCYALTSITSKNTTPPTIGGSYTFKYVDKSIPVYVPKSSVDTYKSAEYWKDFTNIVGVYFVDVIAENGTVEGAGAYEENAEATLTVTPAEGYKFVKWSDGVTDNPRTVVVTSDTTFTAEFGIDDTPISDIQTSDVNVRLIGNNIVVEGADEYTVFSISGQNLGKAESVERGIYIVVVNGKSYKVVAK